MRSLGVTNGTPHRGGPNDRRALGGRCEVQIAHGGVAGAYDGFGPGSEDARVACQSALQVGRLEQRHGPSPWKRMRDTNMRTGSRSRAALARLGLERCGTRTAVHAGLERWTAMGVVAGFCTVVLRRQGLHEQHSDSSWRII